MSHLLYGLGVAIAAYFVGSIPIGLMFARRRGIDIREVGSGNIGAANVARNLGKKLGALVLVLDAVKGAAPLLVLYGLRLDKTGDPFLITLTGFAAIAGHCFPIWLSFNGGKGVATALGVFLVVDPLAAGIGVAAFALGYAAFRIVSIGSILGATTVAAAMWIDGRSDAEVTLAIAVVLVILYRHKGNMARLVRRRELKL